MTQLQIGGYEIKNGCYINDDGCIAEFTLSVCKTLAGKNDIRYRIQADSGGSAYVVEVWQSQINRSRFLSDLPLVIHKEKEFYQRLRRAIIEKKYSEKEVLYQTGRSGLQEAGGDKIFVFSNGSITADGFCQEAFSGLGGNYLPKEAVLDLEGCRKTAQRLFGQYNRNADVFYPLFLFNIMAITNGYFRSVGEPCFMKLTLWLDGSSGSGKTELAKAVGNYTFTDKSLSRELISVTDNRKYALRRLEQSSGMVRILDDVKKERTSERKNSSKNMVDDFLRGIFQGKVTDSGSGKNSGPKWIDACAIITGEYLETMESQNARLLYLKVDGFLKDRKNSEALRVLQENPIWLTAVCSGYIQWFLGKAKESSFPELMAAMLKSLRSETNSYAGIDNAERLNENRSMIEMAAKLSGLYFNDIGMTDKFSRLFHRNAKQSIKQICDDTFCLLGGKEAAVLQILERLFSRCRVRNAVYKEAAYWNPWKYRQEYFWIGQEDHFVWIEDYQESLLKRGEELHGTNNDPPYLIIREEVFMELFKAEIQGFLGEGRISSEIADRILVESMKLLRKMQVIYKQHRSDSIWGRPAAAYPVYEIWMETGKRNLYPADDDEYNDYEEDYGECSDEYGEDCGEYDDEYEEDYDGCGYVPEYDDYNERKICDVSCESVIHFNASHPSAAALKNRMEENNLDQQDLLEGTGDWSVKGMSVEEIYKIRRSFASGKSLFKE